MQDTIGKFIKELGIEEEFNKLSDMLTNNFMIKGEVTEDLAEALRRAPDSLIDLIWEEVVEEPHEEISREEKEKRLYEDIPELFLDEVCFLDLEEFFILGKLVKKQQIDASEIMVVNEVFCKLGWVFTFKRKGGCNFVVMDQLKDIIEGILEGDELCSTMSSVLTIKRLVRVYLNLYGVMKQEKLLQMMMADDGSGTEEVNPLTDEEYSNMLEEAKQLIEILEEREDSFWIDEEYVVSSDLEDRQDYERILKISEGKDYYVPSKADYELYEKELVDRGNKNYKSMKRILDRVLKDKRRADNLLYELEYKAVEEDTDHSSIMELLSERGICFDNRKTAERFSEALNLWLYEIRRWSNCGFSNKELGIPYEKKPMELNLYGVAKEQTDRVKVGRNDPCPCGSGKKYKRCCGKEI